MANRFEYRDPTEPLRGREINGRRWHQASGTQYILLNYSYKKHLQEVRQNLIDGAGNFLEAINENKIRGGITPAAIFGLIRMIMPSIETTARAMGVGPTTLLFALDVPAPNLIWNLYRDMLTHNDEWVEAKVGDKTIKPQIWISMSGSSIINMHIVNHHNGTHTLNVGVLYYDLIAYLDKEIDAAAEDKIVQIINGVEYLQTTSNEEVRQIINEIKITEWFEKSMEDQFISRLNRKMKIKRAQRDIDTE